MADLADLANREVEAFLSEAISQRANESKEPVDFCVECGEDMLPARKKLGLQLCLDCAQEFEKKNRR